MSLGTLPRTMVRLWLGAAKLPLSQAARRVGGRRGGPGTSGPELLVDRADATVRDVIGRLTFDSRLRDDAARRRAAADERERALRLRGEAEKREARADERLETVQERSEEQRRRAGRRRREREHTAAEQEQRRKRASRKVEKKVDEVNARKARNTELDALEERSDALEAREEALVARDEADRLGKAAGRVKRSRKD